MKLWPLLFLILSPLLAEAQSSIVEKPLEFQNIYETTVSLEISGFVFVDDKLNAVSDNSSDTWLYQLDLQGSSAVVSKGLNLKELKGYWPYLAKTVLTKQGGRWKKAPWDLEGAAICGEEIFLVNEQARHLLKASQGKLYRLPVDFAPSYEALGVSMGKVSANAGFEGVAIDCANQRAYIAQERQPRGIFVVDLKNLKVTDVFSSSEENNPHPDYADLFFDKGFLYVLERNIYRVLKIDPSSKEVVGIASYAQLNPNFAASELYDTGEPFGLGEALYMDEQFVYIGKDNNHKPFSAKAQREFGLQGANGAVLKFARPENF